MSIYNAHIKKFVFLLTKYEDFLRYQTCQWNYWPNYFYYHYTQPRKSYPRLSYSYGHRNNATFGIITCSIEMGLAWIKPVSDEPSGSIITCTIPVVALSYLCSIDLWFFEASYVRISRFMALYADALRGLFVCPRDDLFVHRIQFPLFRQDFFKDLTYH